MSSTHSLYLSFPVSLFSITNPQKQQKKSIQQSDSNPNRALVKYFIHTRKNKRTHFTQNYYTLKKVNNNPWRRQHCRNNNKSHTHTRTHRPIPCTCTFLFVCDVGSNVTRTSDRRKRWKNTTHFSSLANKKSPKSFEKHSILHVRTCVCVSFLSLSLSDGGDC